MCKKRVKGNRKARQIAPADGISQSENIELLLL
jgi:hypothetical protein